MKRSIVIVGILVTGLLITGATVASAAPTHPVSAFEASDGCGCHAALVEQWRPSMHAQALQDPLYRVKLEEASKATNGALDAFCSRCHAPIAVMSGELTGLSLEGLSPVSAESVTCDFCHQVTGTTLPLGNTSWVVTSDGTKRAQYDDSVSPVHATAYSAFHETAEFCGTCHNVDHPGNGMHLEATYTEWKNGPYAAAGTVCQDCHMTPGPGVVNPRPGKAAGMGPEREHVYLMTFVGGNVALGPSDLAEERLKGAATLDLQSPEVVTPGGGAEIVVTVTNSGAGHYLPTGLTEVRQMWLEVVAAMPDGAEVAATRVDFGTVLQDAAGNHPVELWDATGIYSDVRIPPQESTSTVLTFAMPTGGPVTVTAALYYRSVPEEMAEKAGVEVPTTTMAEAEATVFGSEQEAREEPPADDEDDGTSAGVPVAVIAAVGVAIVALVARRQKTRRA